MPPNTPFSNAQTQFMNSQAFVNSHKQQQQGPAGLQAPSSLVGGGANSSINSQAVAMQQKLLQQQLAKKHQQPPPMPAQGQPIRGGGGSGGGGGQLAATTVQQLQQQQAQQQQQIVQQLHMAVTAGLISPQLLNQQMTPTMLVMLQQLLQLQQMLQQLVSRQQLLMQQPSKSGSRQQLDATIQEIQQQILRQQQQIAAAQQQQQCVQQAVKQPPPSMPPTHGGGDHLSKDLIKDLSALDMGSMNLKDLSAPGQQQVRSRLTQWKLPSPEKDPMLPPGGDVMLNKVVGGKPLQQSHSTPNLQTKYENNLPFFDSTWSSNLSSASMWPTAMQSMTANSPSQAGEPLIDGTAASSTSKESLVASVVAAAAGGDVTSSTTSGTASPCSESGSAGESLDIVEFFPGKKWQGVETKTIEDDPHMTPGSVSRSLSVNTIKEDYLMSMFGKSNPDGNSPSSSAWSAFSMPNNSCSKSSSAWQPSPTDPTAGPLSSSDPWNSQQSQQQAATVPKNSRPPPGLAPASKTGSSTWQNQFNRSQSWTPGERSLTSSKYTFKCSRTNPALIQE